MPFARYFCIFINVGLQETVNKAGNAVQKTGDTLSGGLTFENDSILAWIRNTDWAKIGFKNDADSDTDSYMWFETGDNGNEYFKWRSKQSTTTKDLMTLKWDALNILVNAVINGSVGIGTTNALGGSSIVLGDNDTGFKQNGDGILDVYANGQHVFRFQNGEVQSTTRTMKVSGALNVSGNTILLGNMNIFGAIAATGQVIPSDYRNFDARYQKRNGGVQDIRLGNQRVDGHYNDDFTVPSGHVVTGGDVAPSSALKLYSRPVQKLINGTWYNVASI